MSKHAKDEIEFIDNETIRHSKKLDYDFQVADQLTRIRLTGSVEFKGGFWEERRREMGGSMILEKVYVPDTRQVHINAIDQLAFLLVPYLDRKYKVQYEAISEKIKRLKLLKKEKKGTKPKNLMNIWYYSRLLKIKQEQYIQLVFLLDRMGMLGYSVIDGESSASE